MINIDQIKFQIINLNKKNIILLDMSTEDYKKYKENIINILKNSIKGEIHIILQSEI